MQKYVLIGQLVSAVIMMVFILVQQKSAGLTGVFGGEGAISFAKRGPEKLLHILTIIVALLFGISSIVAIR